METGFFWVMAAEWQAILSYEDLLHLVLPAVAGGHGLLLHEDHGALLQVFLVSILLGCWHLLHKHQRQSS